MTTTMLISSQVYLSASGLKIFGYDPMTVINIVLALIVLVGAIDKVYQWVTKKGDSFFTFKKKKIDIEATVELDHVRLDNLEEILRKESAAMKDMLKSQLTDKHDLYTSRKPEPYISKYERTVYMTTYQLYNDIDKDINIDQFYRDVINLPLREE